MSEYTENRQKVVDRFVKDFYNKSVSNGYTDSLEFFKTNPVVKTAAVTYADHLDAFHKVTSFILNGGR